MSRVMHVQMSFNGGEISQRLSARIDQSIYDISLDTCIGFAPLTEGPLEAMPGTIRVAAAKGPCRVIPFEFNVTQGHIYEFSNLAVRVFTNDAQVMDGLVPFELATPYSFAQLADLRYHSSEDVTYLFHPLHQTRELVRIAADDFSITALELVNGPFESRNKDKTLTVTSTATDGAVTLTSSSAIFAAGDVGGLFQIEADDFGDVRAWEPGITVNAGDFLVWNERVYEVVASGRTGTLQPVHGEGIEYDGIGTGTDINGKPAGGVQLAFVCDRFGNLRIDSFVNGSEVTATVLRSLPVLTSYRWRFGAFSARRGWPRCGVVWNERLVLFKGRTGYASVAGDLNDHSTLNELGEISPDMAFVFTIPDTNAILHAIPDDKLLMLTAGGLWALGPNNAAQGVGPNNYRADPQSSDGASGATPAVLDSRTLYVGRSRRRVYEADYELDRQVEGSTDLTRYARQIGTPRIVQLAVQHQPFNMVFACRGDGSLAAAAYVPKEQVLGWARRPLAAGVLARDIAAISDPLGELGQIWIAAEFAGSWHILRMGEWRQEGEMRLTAPMVDMAIEYDGAATASFIAPHLPNRSIQAIADGRVYLDIATGNDGSFTLPEAAAHVFAGLPYEARARQLWTEKGGDNGPAMGKVATISAVGVRTLASRGLRLSAAGGRYKRDIEQQTGSSVMDDGFAPQTEMRWFDDMGSETRGCWLEIERVAPVESTILALAQIIEVHDG
jgi:hypothetical protein